jgi:hypothetical protein
VRLPLALVLALATSLAAPAASGRPGPADIAACSEFARLQHDVPAYTETTPTNPFPSQISHVGPWTGPVTPTPEPLPAERSLVPGPAELPEYSGRWGAGGTSQAGMAEVGPTDPRFTENFEACMRARGF